MKLSDPDRPIIDHTGNHGTAPPGLALPPLVHERRNTDAAKSRMVKYETAADRLMDAIYQAATPSKITLIIENMIKRACDPDRDDAVKAAALVLNVTRVLGIRIEATVTNVTLDPEEAKAKVAAFFGMTPATLPPLLTDPVIDGEIVGDAIKDMP